MPRELLILRHAHAEPLVGGGADFDRPLSKEGEREARAVRDWIARHGLKIARSIVSPAVRARRTAEVALPGVVLGFESKVYEATPGTLLALVDAGAAEGITALVGHNPGLEQLVALLSEGRSEDFRGLPPAGVARLALPDAGPIEPATGRILDFWWP
ncbi:MAG TPA: histidine phosphatase family protein [Pseudomonadota bacterium]|nr:histidine phosphatase family protein [Xanthomonadales bacterium]HQW63356.1 histidine phosphatase family protein [Pseudomonadota bacterium]MBP6691888.1 histidine phosphatase family protein [Xanthomonadales bacterium]MBP7418275.1 histidine phosphatase family protein [Xanthomonadales bacterium]MBP8176486.1 histidine phosphatase family protein [Xanthomonadales bacterium]